MFSFSSGGVARPVSEPLRVYLSANHSLTPPQSRKHRGGDNFSSAAIARATLWGYDQRKADGYQPARLQEASRHYQESGAEVAGERC
jgi:hypothetical protein